MKIKLEYVQFIPKKLEPGILYVSQEYGAVAHLCPCGCGTKISTPLSPTDWSLEVTDSGPSLYPSIGNWQLNCQSHYFILKGQIVWARKWTHEQILKGRQTEEKRQRIYYNNLYHKNRNIFEGFWHWLINLFIKHS